MTSSLTWLDHDPAERERMQRILALFQVRETRDELRLGAMRDCFADQMFPATSTIQTRLRYMLFVPWMYCRLRTASHPESSPPAGTNSNSRSSNRWWMLEQDNDPYGVFGRTAGGNLERLLSSLYWAGLGTWGIRRFDGSQGEYHAALDTLYRLRERRAWIADEVLSHLSTLPAAKLKAPKTQNLRPPRLSEANLTASCCYTDSYSAEKKSSSSG